MSLNAFALILLAGLIHAGWNIAAKKAGGDARFAFFTSVLMMLVWAPLGWWLGRDAVPLWGAREWAIVALSGVLTGIFIASYTVVDGYAVKAMLLSPVLVDYMGNFVRVAVLAPVALRNRAETARLWAGQWRFALLVAVVSPIAYVLVLFAMQEAPMAHVAPAREVSMLFAALIGGHLLDEGDRAARLAGALLIAAGVVALALG